MALGRSSNPALGENVFIDAAAQSGTFDVTKSSNVMTVQGAANKTFILLLLAFSTGIFAYAQLEVLAASGMLEMAMYGSIFAGFIVAMITIFKKTWSPYTAPVYALIEGVALGIISAFFEMMYPGIAIQAMVLTFGTLLCLLMAYKMGYIVVTQKFRSGIIAATGAIALVYIISIVMSFFGIQIPMIHEAGIVGIGFSVIVVIIAALNLVLDFDFIDRGAAAKAPKYMEWYAAFGLMVTIVWLYMEILRLLAKLRKR